MTQKLLGNLSRGLLFVLSAPAGTGKTTLVDMLSKEFDCVVESISCTTRPHRVNEHHGKHYHFLSKENFEDKIKNGDFLEYAEVFGYYYGTSSEYVMKQQNMGKHIFLVIDTQGAMQLKEQKLSAVFIFVSPPSLEELRDRLIKRKTEDMEMIEKRLAWAQHEISMVPNFNYHIVNDNLHNAYVILRSIVIAEEHRVINYLKENT
jgi:guanylate kinase